MSVLVHLGVKVLETIKDSDAVQEFVHETLPEAMEKVADTVGDVIDKVSDSL